MIRPLRDRIIVKPIERVKSEVIEVISHEKHCIGEVIAIGEGKRDKKNRLQPLDVKVGDTVRYGGEEYFVWPEYFDHATLTRYHILQEADVAGIVEH